MAIYLFLFGNLSKFTYEICGNLSMSVWQLISCTFSFSILGKKDQQTNMHVETHVLSLDPTQKRNKIMSLWGSGKNPFSCPFFIFWAYICFGRTSSCNINFSVQMQMITTDMYGKTV